MMKILDILRHFVKNILWALVIVIFYLLLVGVIKTGGFVSYFHYLNARDWAVVSSQIDFLHPKTLSDIFYSDHDIAGAMVPESHILDKDYPTGIFLDEGEVVETSVENSNPYDPLFEESFEEDLDEKFGSDMVGDSNFGFVVNSDL